MEVTTPANQTMPEPTTLPLANPAVREKILIVITKSNFGGAQRYVYDLARSLNKTHDVIVASGGKGAMVDKLIAANVPTITISGLGRNVNPFGDLKALFSLISLVRRESPDVVHLNSSKIGIMGAVAVLLSGKKFGKGKKCRTIFTAHAWAFNEDRNFISKTIITFLHWLTVYMCDKTIAVSDAVRMQISHLPKIAHKIVTVHLGIDRPAFYSKKNARFVLGLPEKGFVIGTIAELHPIKGLTYAINAIKDLPFEKNYVIVGEGDDRKKLEAQISGGSANSVTAKNIQLKGFVPDAAQLIPAFDVFLLPSLSEALGYVLIEAGYAGVPVVATAVGGIPEIIKDMESGILIHPKNTKEIERAVSFIHANKLVADKLSKGLKSNIDKEFSLTRMVEQTKSIYKN